MHENSDLAANLSAALKLSLAPVALSFHDEVPSGIEHFSATAPAGCSFWELGTKETFVTTTDDHALCAIGVHTHNLSGAPSTQSHELQDTLGAMMGLDYVREAEVQALPVMSRPHRHVIYGPLADHPVDPDAVLLFCSGRQGLVLTEALHRVDGAPAPAMGRPACVLVPQVVSSGAAAASLGCCGARAYLPALADDITLWGLPGEKLSAYAAEVATLAKANDVLTTFHERRRDDIAAGGRPSVQESLDRLQS